MSFFLYCNQKQSSNCADLWGNFKSRFWTLCNLGLFNGSLNIGKNYQIGVRLGLKRDSFPPPLFLCNSSLIEISSGGWVAFFPPFIHTDLLSGTKKAPHWERESGNSFFRWRLIRFKLGQFLRKKKAQYSPATVIIDVICLSMFLLCFKFLLPKSACFIQCFIATRKLCRVGIL